MATKKQTSAARRNVTKAQRAWKSMTPRQRALAQPQGRGRKKPGTGGSGKFYRIELRPKSGFTSFRTQDVGAKGGLERVAGRRSSGSWATVAWLIEKKKAKVSAAGELTFTDASDRASMRKAVRGKIMHVKADIFKALPARNVPEKTKPTPAMKRARSANIKKAQAARKRN